MKKKFLALLLAVCMVVTMIPATIAAGEGFADTDGHWAEEAIDRWSDYGIIEGSDGLFNPDGELTRGQLAAILARLLNLPEAASAGFGDTDGHWAEDVINRCAAAGIMKGDGVNANPDKPISREETMVMLGRALGIKPVENVDLSHYGDDHAVSDWAAGYVAAMTEAGIVNGIDGNLAPAEDINRASVVTILHRAVTTYVTEPGAVVNAEGGIVVVAAENVTITGEADAVVVTQGAAGGTTALESATVGTVTVQAEDSSVVVGENSTAVSVEVTEQAAGTSVEVAKDAAVGTVTTAAAESTVAVSGTVGTVETTETASNTKVETEAGSTIVSVDNKADGTTVTGSGTVANVTTSGNNTTVETSGTTVEAAQGTTGTTAGGETVTGGSSTTTETTTPSTPSVPTHTCVVISTVVTAPTCTAQGYTTYTTCCASYMSNYTDKYVHQAGVQCPHCGVTEVATAEQLIAAIGAGSSVKLLDNMQISEKLNILASLTIDGNGKTLTYTGSDRAIDVTKETNCANLTIKNLTVNCTASYCQRGINYNTTGTLTLDGVTVVGTNVTYAVNLPGSSIGAQVIIKDSNVTGNIALNVWGANAVINVTDTSLTSVDNNSSEGYAAVVLNNDGTTRAEGTTITITGGSITALNEKSEPSIAVQNGTATGTVTVSNTTTVTGVIKNPVAIVDYGTDQFYSCFTLEDAIETAAESSNATVKLITDIELTETIVIEVGKTVVLDLNGCTISHTKECTDSYSMIANNGNLTITDSVGGGKISFVSTTPDTSASPGYASNTISNYGVITVEGGVIENTTVGGACYALDNYAGSTATINGGELIAEKTAVRVFDWTNGAKSVLNINGGTILSKDGYGINFNMGNTPTVELNITGGTITTNDTDYNLAVYVVSKGSAENVTINVTGGTFNGVFALNGKTSTTMKEGAVSVSGGTFKGVVCYDTPQYGFVSGGTFTSDPSAYVATGYAATQNGSTWTVAQAAS